MRGMPCASHTSWLGTDEGDRSDLDESLSGHGSDSRTCVNDSGLASTRQPKVPPGRIPEAPMTPQLMPARSRI